MSTSTLLASLFDYKQWANVELFACVRAIDEATHQREKRTALRLLDHIHVVDRIFAAHLQGNSHGHTASFSRELASLDALAEAVRETDRWYVDYVRGLTPAALTEPIEFVFTDGLPGRMSREEMLAHVATHGNLHRGGVGRMLAQLSLPQPDDTLTAFLHRTEPARRQRG